MSRISSALRPLVLATTFALAACVPPPATPAPAAPAAEPELELVTYKVNPATSSKVQGILGRLLRPNQDDAVGTYAEAPGGRIAVLAPASVQSGVAAMLEEVGSSDAVEPAPANLRFSYWLVSGTPSTSGTGPLPTNLKPLSDTLASIVGWDGDQFFRLVGHSTLTSVDGERAQSDAADLSVEQTAAIDQGTGRILADVDLRLAVEGPGRPPELETRVQLAPGQTLILSTLDGGSQQPGQMYVIVRADILPGE